MFLKSYYFLKSINNLPGFSGLMRVAEGVFPVFYFFICCFILLSLLLMPAVLPCGIAVNETDVIQSQTRSVARTLP